LLFRYPQRKKSQAILQAIQYSLFVRSRELGTSRRGLALHSWQCEPLSRLAETRESALSHTTSALKDTFPTPTVPLTALLQNRQVFMPDTNTRRGIRPGKWNARLTMSSRLKEKTCKILTSSCHSELANTVVQFFSNGGPQVE
jgi:hypothetical protein